MQTFHPNQCQLSNMSKYMLEGIQFVNFAIWFIWSKFTGEWITLRQKVNVNQKLRVFCSHYLNAQYICIEHFKWLDIANWKCNPSLSDMCIIQCGFISLGVRSWLRWIMISRSNWFTMVFSLHCICNIVWFSNENYVTYQELQSALMSIHSISFGFNKLNCFWHRTI